jgi:tripartite ATP-independent transporter DctP family solute receptor
MRILAPIGAAMLAASLTAFVAGAAAARDFRSADVQPKDFPTVQAVNFIGEQIAKETGGRLGVKVYPDSVLGSEKDVLEQVKLGVIEMARVNIGAFHPLVPDTLVPSMPYIFRDEAHTRKVLDGPIGEEILASLDQAGFVGLCFYDGGVRSIYGKKAVRTPDDIKGMKIRVQQSDLWVAIIKAMGANATPMPTAEVFTGLKVGIVDAAENNYASYQAQHHYEAAPIYSATEHAVAPDMLVFSKLAWAKLSPEDQATIRKAAKDSVLYMRKLWDERESNAKQAVIAAGTTVVSDVDKQAFRALMTPVYDKFLSTPHLKDLAQRIIDTK